MAGRIARVVGFLLAVYMLTACGMYLVQRQIMYHPPAAALPVPPDDFTAVALATEDGLDLVAWHVPARNRRLTIVHFHGNASLIPGEARRARPLAAAGYGVLLVEYRGYGGNPGAPSEAGLIADGRAALAFLERRGVRGESVVLVGESLGTGVAVALAAERAVAGVILRAPYTSAADIAQARYWWLPARWLIKDPFDSLARIGRVQAPLLVVHGRRDRVIPWTFGQRLFDAAAEPKRLVLLDAAGHNDLQRHGLTEVELAFLAGLAD